MSLDLILLAVVAVIGIAAKRHERYLDELDLAVERGRGFLGQSTERQ